MISRRTLAALLAGTVIALPSAAVGDERVALEGEWRGRLGKSGDGVELVFVFARAGTGTIRILDPGGEEALALRVVSTGTRNVVIEAPRVNGRFEGVVAMDGKLEGNWLQAGARLPLTLRRIG